MIPPQALSIIKEFEGLELKAYRCPANVWTIGYGSTRINGRAVRNGDRLNSEAEANTLLISQLEKEFIPKLEVLPGWVEMTDNQRSALISFAWNLGAHFYGSNGFATITNVLRQQHWHLVPGALMLYVKAGNRTLPGLVRRRQAEADLWELTSSPSPAPIPTAIATPQPPKEEVNSMDLFYFLNFAMGLDYDGRLEEGRLVLRSISAQGGRTHQIWLSTSSLASRQKPEDFHQWGGPIPPEYRVPNLRAWEVETTPINLAHVKGVEGNFYKILPFMVKTDKGSERGDFGVHRDANTPGSLGCIVMSGDRFKHFEQEMKRLKDLAIAKIPLFVTYPTN